MYVWVTLRPRRQDHRIKVNDGRIPNRIPYAKSQMFDNKNRDLKSKIPNPDPDS